MLDKKYWGTYYANSSGTNTSPSPFCAFVLSRMKGMSLPPAATDTTNITTSSWRVLDAGCGNGRDTYAFAAHGYETTGVDSSGFKPPDTTNAAFETADFTSFPKDPYTLVYSRFTFHSINDAQQEAFLSSIRKSGTYLCIESRSDKGLEEQRIHGDGHFRNFTSLIKLRRQLLAHAFDIVYQYEGRDAAIYKEENPMCVRVLAKKK